ncbi:hypothetical protein ES711_05035 [Gelidibacter salicanalis]|uniref:Uncharacterized protein n=1 Tax=Gelidibacter salicanalis TaxID=291193 RepID=A0A5C7AKN4_9FLAO|nr:hypothetical protein [Gelidibacter salicanalis]TXE09296.1 hypothetical protein ES711_05035 [Gelidibacter salicanalis]
MEVEIEVEVKFGKRRNDIQGQYNRNQKQQKQSIQEYKLNTEDCLLKTEDCQLLARPQHFAEAGKLPTACPSAAFCGGRKTAYCKLKTAN